MLTDLLVLDKCWLQGAGAAEIRALRSQYKLILTTAFYLEFLTDQNHENRALLAKKFHPNENPGARIFLPDLVRWEIQRQEPAQPVDRFLEDNFALNPGLSVPEFRFRADDIRHLADWEAQNELSVEQFKAQAAVISTWFPALQGFPPSGPRALIEKAMLQVATPDTVLRIYEQFRSKRMPPTKMLDSRWALFRHTQINLLAALEFTSRYGANAIQVNSKRLHNDVIDLEYLIAATMVGAFASRDRQARKFFKLACPNGLLIPQAM